MINLSLGIFLALTSVTVAQSYEVKNDKKIEASAAARAAARIGNLRGSISFDQPAALATGEETVDRVKPDVEGNLAPRPAWEPPKSGKKLPPMVKHNTLPAGVDQTLTGSIKQRADRSERIKWDVFDKYGRIINRR